MPRICPGADSRRGRKRAGGRAKRAVARFFAVFLGGLILPFVVFSQDNGTAEKETFGNGVSISVTVHDDSGAPIPSAATVKLLQGTMPVAQAQTSRGIAVLIVNKLGEFTLVVDAPGFREAQKDLSVGATGSAQADIFLQRAGGLEKTAAAGSKPILAPKAKEALDKGLAALSADKIGEAEKQIALAVKLAPGNADVLYAQGALFMKGGKWSEAQSVLEKATQIDPSHARAFAALGMALEIRCGDCTSGEISAAKWRGKLVKVVGDAVGTGESTLRARRVFRGCEAVTGSVGGSEWKRTEDRAAYGADFDGNR